MLPEVVDNPTTVLFEVPKVSLSCNKIGREVIAKLKVFCQIIVCVAL